jgi:hypothetical protein
VIGLLVFESVLKDYWRERPELVGLGRAANEYSRTNQGLASHQYEVLTSIFPVDQSTMYTYLIRNPNAGFFGSCNFDLTCTLKHADRSALHRDPLPHSYPL